MSVTSGFFNSYNGDRKYSAEQFSALINTLIIDGVFSNVGTAFSVLSSGGSNITVGIGRAWFDSIWVYNDALLPMTAVSSEILLDRIDAVVIEINHSDTVRSARIRFVTGVPSSEPERPELMKTDEVHQYPLAYIYRSAGVDNVVQADITNMVGTSECPYVIGILDTQDIDAIVAKWESQFNIWFEGLGDLLSGDVAGNLALKILELESKFKVLAKDKAVYDDLQDSSNDAIEDNNGSIIQGRTALSGSSSGTYANYYDDLQKVYNTLYEMFDNLNKDNVFDVGDIVSSAKSSIGSNWALCNGELISTKEYPKMEGLIPFSFAAEWKQATAGGTVIAFTCNDGKVIVAVRKTDKKLYVRYTEDLDNPNWSENVVYTSTYNVVPTKMVYLNGIYIIGAAIYSNSSGTSATTALFYSSNLDGPWSMWTLPYTITGAIANSSDLQKAVVNITYGNGYYVVTVNKDLIYYYSSVLGGTWTEKSISADNITGSFKYSHGIEYVNGYFVVPLRGTVSKSVSGGTVNAECVYLFKTQSITSNWSSQVIEVYTPYTTNDVRAVLPISMAWFGNKYWLAVYIAQDTSGSKHILRLLYTTTLSGTPTWTMSSYYMGNTDGVTVNYAGPLTVADGNMYICSYGEYITTINTVGSIKNEKIVGATFNMVLLNEDCFVACSQMTFNMQGYTNSYLYHLSKSDLCLPSISLSDNSYTYIKVKG